MLRLVPLLLAALALFAAPAQAGVEAGDTEVGIFGLLSSDNEADTTTIVMGANAGRFVTDNLEVKGSLSMAATSDADGYGTTLLFLGGGADLVLGGAKQTFVPYIGGLLNLTTLAVSTAASDITGVGLTIDLHIGGKIFLSERASLDMQLRQITGTVTASDDAGNDFDIDISNTDLVIGINIYL